jgi:hypothetical protein
MISGRNQIRPLKPVRKVSVMPAAKPRVFVEPRIISRREVALLLGRGETWLAANLARLIGEGMPQLDPLLNGWDAKAIHRWLDQRAGLVSHRNGAPDDTAR